MKTLSCFLMLVSLLIAIISLPSPVAIAKDELTQEQRGRGKAQLCTRCHGRLGLAKAAKAQNWEGSVESFIQLNLKQFRDGTRVQAVMNAVAEPMSDLDINDVAAWYEKISGFEVVK